MSRAREVAARLVPVLVLVWGLPAALYLTLTKFGQAEDLMRATGDNVASNFFFSMSLLGFTTAGWIMAATSLRTLTGVSDWVKIALATVLSMVGPTIIALAYPAHGTIGEILVYTGVLVPACGLAFLMTPSQRQGREVNWWIASYTRAFAAVAVLSYGIIFLWPAFWSRLLGPVTVLLVVGCIAIWSIWFLATRAPVVAIAFLVTAAFAIGTGRFGERPVRTANGPHTRISSADYAREWLTKHPGKRPLLVTSDGGGLRSAYWTAIVLGSLAAQTPAFLDQMYVASGVSGGSVGVAEFASMPNEQELRRALSGDFLAEPLTRLVTRDPLDSISCYGWGWRFSCSGTDRQVAAESAFEAACPRLASFINNPLPFAIALNATNADTGLPLVTSNVRLGGPQDLLEHMPEGMTLRLSSAMLLSARFPIISPVGELELDRAPVRVVDGGYFDNSGSATAQQMLDVLLGVAGSASLKPIGVLVTNEPARARGRFCPAPPETAADRHTSFVDLFITPVGTLDAGRQNAAEAHRLEFRRAIERLGGDVLELPLFRCESDPQFPLGWTLSDLVRQHMDDKLTMLRQDPNGPYRKLVSLLQ